MSIVDFLPDFTDIFHAIFMAAGDKLCAWGDRLYICVERYMLENFAIDLLVIWASLRPASRLRPERLALAAVAGALFSGYIYVSDFPEPFSFFCALAFTPVIVLIAAGRSSICALAGASASLICVSSFTAALVNVTPLSLIPSAAVSSLAATFFLGRRRRWLETWEAEISIAHAGVHSRFRALIDTGNRLTEPLSGLPVLVVEESLLAAMLPNGFDPANAVATLPRGFRPVAFGGLGGEGALGCFMPDGMHAILCGRRRRISNVWVAVYPGVLPGSLRALAPASFIVTR